MNIVDKVLHTGQYVCDKFRKLGLEISSLLLACSYRVYYVSLLHAAYRL